MKKKTKMKEFSKIGYLTIGAVASNLLISGCHQPLDTVKSQRPNILFILTDDQRYDALGVMGNPYIETPNIDSLAAKGIVFNNAYIMGSNHGAVCRPSRSMLLTGLGLNNVYPELSEITTEQWENDTVIGVFRPFGGAIAKKITFPQALKSNGYVTFGTGKWHNCRNSFLNGFDKGRDIFFGGMADHFNTPVTNLNEDGTFSRSDSKGFSTDIFTSATLEFFNEHAAVNNDKPFFAYVSYTAPHDPRSPALEYIDYYGESSLPVPPNLKSRHPFGFEGGETVTRRPQMTIRDEQTGTWPRTPEQITKQLADYYGLITHIDDDVGQMISRLKDLDMMDNTIIIFTSDNGLAMGSHGLLGKQSLYEHSIKVPLVISGPGIPEGNIYESLVYLHDLYPTIFDMTGVEIPEGLDGENLMPLVRGEREHVRDVLFTIYWDFIRAVRDDRYKLITYPLIHHIQLFDLHTDPQEVNNLAYLPEFQNKVEQMLDLLEDCKREAKDHFPMFTQKIWPMDYSLEGFTPRPDVHQPEYIIEKYFK